MPEVGGPSGYAAAGSQGEVRGSAELSGFLAQRAIATLEPRLERPVAWRAAESVRVRPSGETGRIAGQTA